MKTNRIIIGWLALAALAMFNLQPSTAFAQGTAFSYQITASNSPTSFSAAGLPDGLSVNTAGLISGTPTAAATQAKRAGSSTICASVRSASI